jgi:hypothetical protein
MVKIKCDKCSYSWETQSELGLVTCPSCGNKIKTPSFPVEPLKKSENHNNL